MASAKRDVTEAAPNVSNMPNMSDMESEQIGFLPYWEPAEGKKFYGVVIARDERDPEFVRYQIKALVDTPTQKGPSDKTDPNHEELTTKAGDDFSISVYYSMEPVFNEYLQCAYDTGTPIAVLVEAVRKVKTNDPKKSVWIFRAGVSKEHKAVLNEYRTKKQALKLGAGKAAERPQLNASGS